MIIRLQLGEPIWRTVNQRELQIEWNVPSCTLLEFLKEAINRYPELGQELLDSSGEVDLHFTFFLNGHQVRWSEGGQTFLSDGDEVLILLPLSGG